MAVRRKHWTQTVKGRKRQSDLQKARWERHRAGISTEMKAAKHFAANGVASFGDAGKEMTIIKGILKSFRKLSPAGINYVKERLRT